MYNELNSFVNNIISIGNGDKRLIIQGQIFLVNEHHYTCNADQLKCMWDIDTRILKPVLVHKKKCKAVYNGLQVLIPSDHNKIVKDQASETFSLHNIDVDIKFREFQDPIFHTKGQLYMSEQGIQQFICLNTSKVKVDNILMTCHPNETLTVTHSVTLDNTTYFVESHFMSEDNLQRVVRNFSLLPTLDLIHETKYNITLDDVPPIHYVQLQTYISYGLIGLLILLIIPLILCWCYPMAK